MEKLRGFGKIILIAAVLATVSLAVPSEKVSATVGGPTYISAIGFSKEENAAYYTVNDYGGRGCLPIVHKVDLSTQKDSEVKTCSQLEQEFSGNEAGREKYNQFVMDIYQKLSYLGSVSLKKNNIRVEVEFLSENLEDGYPIWSEFRATLTQDDKEIGKINFRGCAKDQPHIFEGYMVPNSDIMAMLISNKGDCFEGGYVREGLHILKGVRYYDTNIIRSFKEASATEPNTGNLVVYTRQKAEEEEPAPVPEKSSRSYLLWFGAIFVTGAALGYFARKS